VIKQHLLEARMKEKQIEPNELCDLIGMQYQSFYKRVKGKVDFKLKEINAIRKVLDLTCEQTDEIFYYDVELKSIFLKSK